MKVALPLFAAFALGVIVEDVWVAYHPFTEPRTAVMCVGGDASALAYYKTTTLCDYCLDDLAVNPLRQRWLDTERAYPTPDSESHLHILPSHFEWATPSPAPFPTAIITPRVEGIEGDNQLTHCVWQCPVAGECKQVCAVYQLLYEVPNPS